MNGKTEIVTIVSKDAFTKKGLLESIKNGLAPDNAISWAAENGHTELVELLVSKGADIIENRNYPLELASRNGHTDIVKLLIDNGARTYDSELDEGLTIDDIIINKTEICMNTRYFIPAFKTSFFSFSNITRKNELNDIISQQIKNIKAFWQVTTASIDAISIGKKTRWELIFLSCSKYGLRYPFE